MISFSNQDLNVQNSNDDEDLDEERKIDSTKTILE